MRLGNGGTQSKTESKERGTGVLGGLQVWEGRSKEVGETILMRESWVGGGSGKRKTRFLGQRGPKLRE